jgi:uncharacterized protein
MAVFAVSKDHKGEWRWSFAATNHETIAVASEGYHNRSDCLHALKLVKEQGPRAPVYDITTDPPQEIPGV